MPEERLVSAVERDAMQPAENAVKSRILDVIAQEIASGQNAMSIYSKTPFGKSAEKKRD